MTRVVASILRQDGKILICQRTAAQPHPLKWEFPGGKIEPGESPEVALARELREELDVECEIGVELLRYEFSYPEKKAIELIFLEATHTGGVLTNKIFEDLVWCDPATMNDYDFLEGDRPFLEWFTRKP